MARKRKKQILLLPPDREVEAKRRSYWSSKRTTFDHWAGNGGMNGNFPSGAFLATGGAEARFVGLLS
jgi:hypothetical protein